MCNNIVIKFIKWNPVDVMVKFINAWNTFNVISKCNVLNVLWLNILSAWILHLDYIFNDGQNVCHCVETRYFIIYICMLSTCFIVNVTCVFIIEICVCINVASINICVNLCKVLRKKQFVATIAFWGVLSCHGDIIILWLSICLFFVYM